MKNKYYTCGKSHFTEKEKEVLKKHGFNYFYELRSWDIGDGYNIEPHVLVNNIGCIATNFEIKFKDKKDQYIENNEFYDTYKPVSEYVDLKEEV